MKRILVIKSDNGGCWLYRMFYPYMQLCNRKKNNIGVDCGSIHDAEDGSIDFSEYDAVVFHQNVRGYRDVYEKVKQAGAKLIIDVDDYWVLSPLHPLFDRTKVQEQKAASIRGIRCADLVTTTTEALAEKIRPINANVVVCPNAIHPNDEQFQGAKHKRGKVFRVGFVGGSSHYEDVLQLAGLVEELDDPEIQVRLCGFDLSGAFTREQVDANVWTRLERALTSDYKTLDEDTRAWLKTYTKAEQPDQNARYVRVPTRDIMEYGTMYSELDAVVVPLCGTDFDRYKSELKLIEAGAYNLPVIVSDVYPYKGSELAKHCVLMRKGASARKWARAIKHLKNNPILCDQLGRELGETMRKNYDLDEINNKRYEAIKRLIDGGRI